MCYIAIMFKRRKKIEIDLPQISLYVKDLKEITQLRDHALKMAQAEEAQRYNESIEIMQIVLNMLNQEGIK